MRDQRRLAIRSRDLRIVGNRNNTCVVPAVVPIPIPDSSLFDHCKRLSTHGIEVEEP